MTYDRFRDVLADARSLDDARLLMAKHDDLEVRYAPFDHVNPVARIVILGITPGRQQADVALQTARSALSEGLDDKAVLRASKLAASFSGPMRVNLIAMLDFIGVASALGIASTATLWNTDSELAQFASALRYPVLKAGLNYTGSSPDICASTFLLDQLRQHTAAELATLQDALVVPLGPAVEAACTWLIAEGVIAKSQMLRGLQHPSGANAERVAYFLGRKTATGLSSRTNAERIDRGRELARESLEAWLSQITRSPRPQTVYAAASDGEPTKAAALPSTLHVTHDTQHPRNVSMAKTILRIERKTPRPGGIEEPEFTTRGYRLGDPSFGSEKHHSTNSVFARTLEEAAELIEKGFSLWMVRKGKRASLISPASLRIVRA